MKTSFDQTSTQEQDAYKETNFFQYYEDKKSFIVMNDVSVLSPLSDFCGTVVWAGSNSPHPVGYYSSYWGKTSFKLVHGTVTLSNE